MITRRIKSACFVQGNALSQFYFIIERLMTIEVVILAAGQGTRMHSNFSKVLHRVANKSLLEHVYDATQSLHPQKTHIVIGHHADEIKNTLQLADVNWIYQEAQLGTGHAVLQALPFISPESRVLILPGDVPCISDKTLQNLIAETALDGLGILTGLVNNPSGLGRIVRNAAHQFECIVEEKDATQYQKQINEINAGVMLVPAHILHEFLPQLSCNNAQKEYYLTDIPHLAKKANLPISLVRCLDAEEIQGVNDRYQLSLAERYYQQKQAKQLMQQGTTIRDPARFDLRGTLSVGQDVEFDLNVLLEGDITIGDRCQIGANVILRHVTLGDNVHIKDNCVIENAVIGEDCRVGPFARIRPDTHLSRGVHVGNFVEIKKSLIDEGSKINHLSYVGDAEIGKQVNVGAGVITCNYDGVNKFKTIIEDSAFIGSNCSLVAPITIARNATIGAGSTLSKDAPEDALTLGRAKQVTISSWRRPTKKEV
jgi:bifunctional UDP-N-acetylglucosamine pyrophosphorylase / glucosamine-1-phosphate N-acetyltransferase